MTNAEYQKHRIGQGGSLLTTLHEVIEMHCEEQGLEPVSALTDALTDMRHLADVYGLDYGEIDDKAYNGYIEESDDAAREQETQTDVTAPNQDSDAQPRLVIHEWREYGDDEDSLSVFVVPSGEEFDAIAYARETHDIAPPEDPNEEQGPGVIISVVERIIQSGDLFTAENGKVFRVTIEEVK